VDLNLAPLSQCLSFHCSFLKDKTIPVYVTVLAYTVCRTASGGLLFWDTRRIVVTRYLWFQAATLLKRLRKIPPYSLHFRGTRPRTITLGDQKSFRWCGLGHPLQCIGRHCWNSNVPFLQCTRVYPAAELLRRS
jgi:hypothetical protein